MSYSDMITLEHPLSISARLLPAVRFDTFTVSLDPGDWSYYIDFHGEAEGVESVEGHDFTPSPFVELRSDGEAVRDAMASLLAFVAVFGEEDRGDDWFPDRLHEWASLESEEVSLAGLDLREDDQS